MEIVPAGIPASITKTLDQPGLFMGATIWDDSGSSPVQITGLLGMINNVLPMLNWQGNSYRVKFQGVPGIFYLAQIASYTDETYTAVGVDEPEGDESFTFSYPVNINGVNGLSGSIQGIIDLR